MNRPDPQILSGFPGDKDGPQFNEPWEAQAFALTIAMYEKGMFEWNQWSQILGAVIAADKDNHSYYESWLKALEMLVGEKQVLSGEEITRRKAQWRQAVATTPHGQPIVLADEE